MQEAVARLMVAAEADAPGDDEYLGMAANCALVLIGARRGARLDLGLKIDGSLERELKSIRGYRLVAWDGPHDSTKTWTEPLFVPAKHEAEALDMVGLPETSPKAWRLMGRLLGYPEGCKRGRDGSTVNVVLALDVQRGIDRQSVPVFLAGVVCSETRKQKVGALLQAWADKGNATMAGKAYGPDVRLHFKVTLW